MKSKEKEKGKSRKSADKEEKKRKEERKAEKAERKAEKVKKQEAKDAKSGKNKKKKAKYHEAAQKKLKSEEYIFTEKAAGAEKNTEKRKEDAKAKIPVGMENAVMNDTAAETKTASEKKKAADAFGEAVSGIGAPGAEKGTSWDMEAYADVFRALGDESRIQILKLLAGKELCGAELLALVPIVQSTLSHHMKVLCESGLVNCRKQGRWAYYTLDKKVFAEVADCLKRQTGE